MSLEDRLADFETRLAAVEAKLRRKDSLDGVACVECGVPAVTRWGRWQKDGDPMCKRCYNQRYFSEGGLTSATKSV